MRKFAVLISLLALGAGSPAPEPETAIGASPARLISPAPDCRKMHAAKSGEEPVFRRLGELPPADAYQAVYRLGADGCIDPLLVSDRIRQSSPPPRR